MDSQGVLMGSSWSTWNPAAADSLHQLPRYRGFLAPATALPRILCTNYRATAALRYTAYRATAGLKSTTAGDLGGSP